ncbi:MAG: hypothetical protein ACTSWC_13480 [Promethearchaeota archaeon]
MPKFFEIKDKFINLLAKEINFPLILNNAMTELPDSIVNLRNLKNFWLKNNPWNKFSPKIVDWMNFLIDKEAVLK